MLNPGMLVKANITNKTILGIVLRYEARKYYLVFYLNFKQHRYWNYLEIHQQDITPIECKWLALKYKKYINDAKKGML